MRGMGHSDPIETVAFKHEEGNEGEKIGVKRRIGAFCGGKLLKRQGRWTDPALLRRRRFFRRIGTHATCPPSRKLPSKPDFGRGTVVNSAERDSPHHAIYHDERSPTIQSIISLTGGPFREQNSFRCNCWVLDDKAFGPLAAVAIVLFSLRQDFCQIQDSPS
jgi:hypothetical protein